MGSGVLTEPYGNGCESHTTEPYRIRDRVETEWRRSGDRVETESALEVSTQWKGECRTEARRGRWIAGVADGLQVRMHERLIDRSENGVQYFCQYFGQDFGQASGRKGQWTTQAIRSWRSIAN